MAKGLYESINNSLDNLVRSITPTEKKKVTGTKNINESASLVEKKVPDEDKYENDLIKSIIRKRKDRTNAKLTPEEQKVYDKYGLESFPEKSQERYWDSFRKRYAYGPERADNVTKVGRRKISAKDTWANGANDGKKNVNFVDMARKGPERHKRYEETGISGNYSGYGLGGSRENKYSYSDNATQQLRYQLNTNAKSDYNAMRRAISKRNENEREMDYYDKRYDEEKNFILKKGLEELNKEISDAGGRRDRGKSYYKKNYDDSVAKINAIKDKHRKNKNESASRKRQRRIVESVAKRRQLIEKAVPEEDRYENDLIKSIINKRADRVNAKLEPAEQAVANKYGITTDRFNSGVKTTVGRRNIPRAYRGKGYDDINYVDMARKGPERATKSYETGIDVVDRRFSGINGSREGKKNEPYSKNALLQSRDRLNREMQSDYREVSDRARTKKYYKGVLDNVDNEFDKKRDDYIAKINNLTRELANVEKNREEKRAYNKKVIDNITNSQKEIINKHRKNKNESLKKNCKRK